MKKLVGVSLFAVMAMMGSSVYAASTTGEAQVNLVTPLSITEAQSVNFGDIGIESGTSGTITMSPSGTISCPPEYSCPSIGTIGLFTVQGKADEVVNVSVNNNATLALPVGGLMLTFVPSVDNSAPTLTGGMLAISVGGSITIAGTETAGPYSTTNTANGGVPYGISVVY